MKSGLEDRNNGHFVARLDSGLIRLNEVRPGRPEQYIEYYDFGPLLEKSQ